MHPIKTPRGLSNAAASFLRRAERARRFSHVQRINGQNGAVFSLTAIYGVYIACEAAMRYGSTFTRIYVVSRQCYEKRMIKLSEAVSLSTTL
ncbi:hypothetical protein FKP32DRAFT_1593072 [Trametes sanguinea]|nr:hypothetical protein FKP32DRAFT_1593072 [Trametes sanguinea]